ncbi:MAG: penicillin-binding protein 1C [Gemmatimonadales bacterium]|jgi:penicillin-binding protein 1C
MPPIRFRARRPRPAAKIITAAVVVFAGSALAAGIWIAAPLPAALADPGQVPSLTLQDRNGLPLRTTRASDGSRGGWIALADIDPDIIRAFLAVEDERFYEHKGVDLHAVARAARDNLRAGTIVSGASTITMQTARLLRSIARSWPGKFQQVLWALRLEAHLDKQSILEIYLNRLPLGQGTVGVSAAASLYFDASASDVSLSQAALLASLAHAPSRDNPLVAPDRATTRRARVLDRLASLGYADADEIARASREPLVGTRSRAPFLAPHFTTRILQWAEEDGLPLDGVWRTSLDLDLQTVLEAEVRHTVGVLADRRAEQAAAVVLENRSGHILAWVGSPDFWAEQAGQVDMVVSRRQPGSALKPFLYGLAFDRGFTPASVLPDIPRTYDTQTGPYSPRNYDRRFRGPVRAREALASSYNVPAVELADRIGASALLATLRRAGFVSLDGPADHYGIGLALGNGEVTLLELANAYRALVAGGTWRPYRWLVSGPSLASGGPVERRVISEAAAYLVLDVLSDPVARIPGFGVETPFDFPFPVAAKTGTSRRFTDNWAVGTTGAFTVAVWVGNFSGRPMAGVSGISGAGPLLHRAVLATARRVVPGELPTPAEAGAIPVAVCRLSGLVATPECPSLIDWFAPGSEPHSECDWHREGRVILPPQYAEWTQRHEPGVEFVAALEEPASVQSVVPRFRIVAPQDGDRYTRPPNTDPRYASIALRAVGPIDSGPVRWWVDGTEMAVPRWQLQPGLHTIRAEVSSGESDEVTIFVEE